MPQLADLISRLFTSGRTQGLSGGAEVVVDRDPAAAFYASRLRRHKADGDLVTNPELLWIAGADPRKGGLRSHIHAERGDGIASFTDVLLIISQADARRAAQAGSEPWTDRTARVVGERFSQYCAQERFELVYGTRPLRFWIIADGGSDMAGEKFGLEAGEFISGLLPNLYVGPAQRSRPVLAVHLNLPGVWEGYREVGRLYSDQIVFTLGRHWLDNFHHPALREPGIYRLQQYPDGSLVHVINPELQDRYLVRSDQTEAGPSVLTIAEFSGRPVAYLVLAVIESQTVEVTAEVAKRPKPEAGDRTETMARPPASEGPVRMTLPTPPPAPLPPEPETEEQPTRSTEDEPASLRMADAGSPVKPPLERARTIVPDAVDGRLLTLHERGALLQRVHFANFMEGYDVYIGAQGKVATLLSNPRATLQVRQGRVMLVVHDRGVRVDNKAVEPGRGIALVGKVQIDVDGAPLEYDDLSQIKVEGWPYVGELRRPGVGSYLEFGQGYRVGRDRRCKIRLPDEPHNDNIAWLPSVGGGATIRSRTGDIPKSRFYTDSIMVASEHAELDLEPATPVLRSLARHCYSYVRRNGEILVLFPREGAGGLRETPLQPGDELLIGNCLFQVSYPPVEGKKGATVPDAAPPRFSPASLASAVDPAVSSKVSGIDLVGAHGLGERGPAPKPVRLTSKPSSTGGEAPRKEAPAPVPVPRPVPPAPPPPPPPMMIEDPDPVVSVEARQWQLELSRPARLIQLGWSVAGDVTIGNHRGASMIVPEVRAFPEQAFMTLEYFRLFVRGKKGKIELLQEGEARLKTPAGEVSECEELDRCELEIIRRDENLEPDFTVNLVFDSHLALPDPRARLLAIDATDRFVAALFTLGVPHRAERRVWLGPIEATVIADGSTLRISNYLASYRTHDAGYLPLLWREQGGEWRTFPEDGSAVELRPGQEILAGISLYRFTLA